jgi:putative ABC transport system permease protein
MEHVETVLPLFQLHGWAIYDGRSQSVLICSALPDNPFHLNRIVAGNFFKTPNERSVIVSEFLLYSLGVADDAEVPHVLGKKLRLEYRVQGREPGFGLYLIKSDSSETSRAENLALEKVRRQLPAALDKLDLTPEEKNGLRRTMQTRTQDADEVISEELTIAGVLRPPGTEEQEIGWNRFNTDAEVLLPLQTAEELYFRVPTQRDRGVDHVTITADREENVKELARQISEIGFQVHAPLEYIARERLIYLMVFSSMAFVACVALVVAALGIANTMFMSVLERTREVGIMKAVGAYDVHIQIIFLVEGALIGLVGGILGLVSAWAASIPGDAWVRSMVSRDLKVELKEALFVFPWWLSSGVILFAIVVTTLAAVWPARRASRLDPVTALRHE